jgi:hypothetical protein
MYYYKKWNKGNEKNRVKNKDKNESINTCKTHKILTNYKSLFFKKRKSAKPVANLMGEKHQCKNQPLIKTKKEKEKISCKMTECRIKECLIFSCIKNI